VSPPLTPHAIVSHHAEGIGEALLFYVQRYYLLDDVGMSSRQMGQVTGFAGIPWQLKSLFGVLSDTIPINGLHRAPYVMLAGIVGTLSTTLLVFLPASTMSADVLAGLLLMINLNFAMPDVMIDATVAERSKQRPHLAAELQALCWGSINTVSLPALVAKGYLYDAGGAKSILGVCIGTAACVLIPASLGWMESRAAGAVSGVRASAADARRLCGSVWTDPIKRRVAGTAVVVGLFSITIGMVNLEAAEWAGLTSFCIVADFLLCGAVYLLLRGVDETLARAAVFTFLHKAVCPETSAAFAWFHDPGDDDSRCFSAEMCTRAAEAAVAALSNATALPVAIVNGTAVLIDGALFTSDPLSGRLLLASSLSVSSLSPPPSPHTNAVPSAPATAALNTSSDAFLSFAAFVAAEGSDMPCGWARSAGNPCISTIFYSWVLVAGRVALALGVWAYVNVLQGWSYRRVFTLTQALMAAAALLDYVWVLRLNLEVGISDEVAVLFGDEVIRDFAYKLNQLPFLIYSAKLCPSGVEASMFALFMGLSNFGKDAASFLGSALMQAYGGVAKPHFEHLGSCLLIQALLKAVPILFVPLLVPQGTPRDTAKEMGAGAGVMRGEDVDGDATEECNQVELVSAASLGSSCEMLATEDAPKDKDKQPEPDTRARGRGARCVTRFEFLRRPAKPMVRTVAACPSSIASASSAVTTNSQTAAV
jgi:hypothetical protein